MTKEDIVKFIEWADGMIYVDFIDSEWQIIGSDIFWDLLEDDGDEREWNYCVETRSDPLMKDGFMVVNGDTGCGETVTYIFEAHQEVV